MDNILDKIYSHYLDNKEIEIKKKEILSINSLKVLINTKKESNETYYKTEKYFIKITNNNMDKNSIQKYNLTKNNLFLSKFPKEILINNLLKKELYNNIINIHNYYFSENVSILVMDRDGELFIDFFLIFKLTYR